MAHIPSGTTAQIDVLTFREALASANTPSADYDIGRWLYAPCLYSEYRYILGTRGEKPLICIGINPSTAKPDALDNTLKSVERIAIGNGYDSFLMFNVYAQRATDPDTMERVCNARTWRPSAIFSRCQKRPPSGLPGVPSLKSGRTCPNASGICWKSAGSTVPAGTAPAPSPKRGTLIILCICARTKS